MSALKWKDRKGILALGTIRSFPVPRPAPRDHNDEEGNMVMMVLSERRT